MSTYILQRLLAMIPTLFGVTLVSFLIMQLAPGDPVKQQLNQGGAAQQSGNTREAYLVRKRDLRMDLPLVLNFRPYVDHAPEMRWAAFYLGRDKAAIEADLERLGFPLHRLTGEERGRLDFLRGLGLENLAVTLHHEEPRARLARELPSQIEERIGDLGRDGFPAMLALAKTSLDRTERIGAVRALRYMTEEPFRYTFSVQSKEGDSAETAAEILAVWKLWWEREHQKFPPLDAEAREVCEDAYKQLLAAKDALTMQRVMLDTAFERGDLRFFAEHLLDPKATFRDLVVCSMVLRQYVSRPLEVDVPLQATDAQLAEVLSNWELHVARHEGRYRPTAAEKAVGIFTNTQYAAMLGRLLTFDFGRSSNKTREPVRELLWNAIWVSAPLMVLAQVIIYLVAVPLGVMCAAWRGTVVDRGTSIVLFFLFSIPPFVAAMLMLLYLCYGSYLKWFPSSGLHSAELMGKPQDVVFWLDYAWHLVLPTICLSLFSLAGVAMYARASMLEVLGQDYIRTARSVGVSSFTVTVKHAFRNSLITVITLFAGLLPAMLGGSVLIEYLFNIHGMGRLSFTAIEQKDIPTLMALIYLDAIVVMASILLTDLLYVVADPRITFDAQGSGR